MVEGWGGWGERELRECAFIVVVIFLSNFQLLLQCESNNQFNLVTVLLFNIIFYIIYIIIIRPLYIYLLILGNIGEMQGFYGDFITTLHYLE